MMKARVNMHLAGQGTGVRKQWSGGMDRGKGLVV
jgi:hypothetical protein